MADPVAYIYSARSNGGVANLYILRPPQNVMGKMRPNISQIRSQNGLIGAIFHDPGLIYVGDEIVAGENTWVTIEFFIGARHHFSHGGSGQVLGERNVVDTGLVKAKKIKELGEFLAWQVVAWGLGAAARAVSVGGVYMKGGAEVYKTIPKIDLSRVQFFAGDAPDLAMTISMLMHGKILSNKSQGMPSAQFGKEGIRG